MPDRKVHIVPNVDTYEVSLVDVPAIGEKFTIFQFAVDKLYQINNSTNWKAVNHNETLEVHQDENYQWDATSARERIVKWARNEAGDTDINKYKNAFLVYDRSNPENIDSYKYPIADVIDGELKVVPRAVYASAILSLRLGVSSAMRDVLKKQIGSLYTLLDKTPPWNGEDIEIETTEKEEEENNTKMEEKEVTQETQEEVIENTVLDETQGVTDKTEGVTENTVSATENTESVTDKTRGVVDAEEEEAEVETAEEEEEESVETEEVETESVESEEVEDETEEEEEVEVEAEEDEEVQLRANDMLVKAVTSLNEELVKLREQIETLAKTPEEFAEAVESVEVEEVEEQSEKEHVQNRQSQLESPLEESEDEENRVSFNGLYDMDPLRDTQSRIRESLERIYHSN